MRHEIQYQLTDDSGATFDNRVEMESAEPFDLNRFWEWLGQTQMRGVVGARVTRVTPLPGGTRQRLTVTVVGGGFSPPAQTEPTCRD